MAEWNVDGEVVASGNSPDRHALMPWKWGSFAARTPCRAHLFLFTHSLFIFWGQPGSAGAARLAPWVLRRARALDVDTCYAIQCIVLTL